MIHDIDSLIETLITQGVQIYDIGFLIEEIEWAQSEVELIKENASPSQAKELMIEIIQKLLGEGRIGPVLRRCFFINPKGFTQKTAIILYLTAIGMDACLVDPNKPEGKGVLPLLPTYLYLSQARVQGNDVATTAHGGFSRALLRLRSLPSCIADLREEVSVNTYEYVEERILS